MKEEQINRIRSLPPSINNLDEVKVVYFLGVGGIGMSAIARYFLYYGCEVYGYDKTKTVLTEQLEEEGVTVHYEEDVAQLPEKVKQASSEVLVVYTPAIPRDNQEVKFFEDSGIALYKRSEVLGLISRKYFTVAIAGTHGKTTISSMVAHMLCDAGVNTTAFLGGVSLNVNSNFLIHEAAKVMVVEADEFDRSFLALDPDIALVSSLDSDHLDVYGTENKVVGAYQEFIKKIKKGGILITKPEYLDVLSVNPDINYKTYAIHREADFFVKSVTINKGDYFVDVENKFIDLNQVKIGLPGIHNVENAVGTIAIGQHLNLDSKQLIKALASYKGVKRRFEYHIRTDSLVYIDDYAHHPTELSVCIRSVRELYPSKRITGIFQPHLYSRTRDFVDEFAESLSMLDELILLDIYPARELPIEGVSAQLILEKANLVDKTLQSKETLLDYLRDRHLEVLLTLGAGDIDTLVKPIKKLLTENRSSDE